MPWSRSNGVNIYYEVAGEGPGLVLLHANPFDHTMWVYQIARFSTRYKVIAIDLRGYGRSDKPESSFSFSDMANDVVAVIRDQRLERAALAGVSIGATLSLQIALDHPSLVRALILAGGEAGNPSIFRSLALDYATKPIAEQRAAHIRMIVDSEFAQSPIGHYLLAALLEPTLGLSGKSIARIFEARAAVNLQNRLGFIAIPTLVINGAHDVSLESGRYTASRIPKAIHCIIPGAGHLSCIENPRAFDSAVFEFLESQGRDGVV